MTFAEKENNIGRSEASRFAKAFASGFTWLACRVLLLLCLTFACAKDLDYSGHKSSNTKVFICDLSRECIDQGCFRHRR